MEKIEFEVIKLEVDCEAIDGWTKIGLAGVSQYAENDATDGGATEYDDDLANIEFEISVPDAFASGLRLGSKFELRKSA